VFIGYLSSFFIAILLSLCYLSYAAGDILEYLKKEIKKETKEEVSFVEAGKNTPDIFTFVLEYPEDISYANKQFQFSKPAAEIFVIADIPISKPCLSGYFLRPPPKF
jgi:hypothetical protein